MKLERAFHCPENTPETIGPSDEVAVNHSEIQDN
jgi:hypothetical protein